MKELAKLHEKRDVVVSEHNVTELFHFLRTIYEQCPHPEDIVFICIGTDQSTGDSFGPLMGSMLTRKGFPNVIGTLAFPCDAYRVEDQVQALQRQSKLVVAIDACLGKPKQVGQFVLNDGPLLPGAATGKGLPAVGDYSIAAVVNEIGPKAYWKIQNASLYVVMELVDVLSAQISKVWGLDKEDSR